MYNDSEQQNNYMLALTSCNITITKEHPERNQSNTKHWKSTNWVLQFHNYQLPFSREISILLTKNTVKETDT